MDVLIIGAGIGGMGAANVLAHAGHHVTVVEKNEDLGGRAGFFEANGFKFDTGPTWYLMPDVFERYFAAVGRSVEDYLELRRLQPTYRILFQGKDEPVDFYSDPAKDLATAERLEKGGSARLAAYLKKASRQYSLMSRHFFYNDCRSVSCLLKTGSIPALWTIPLLGTMNSHISKRFASEEMRKTLQYTSVFLGSSPFDAPALYTVMSHVDLNQGAFYPKGGIHSLINALQTIGTELGVRYETGTAVQRIIVHKGKATGVELADGRVLPADAVLSNADLHHTESQLLEPQYRTYSEKYWKQRTLAPSAFLLFLGVKGKLPQLAHHTLVFSQNWEQNFAEIFERPAWPENPSLYVCASSRTDPAMAPEGCEGVFVLVPVAPGLEDSGEQRERYKNKILGLLQERLGVSDLAERIVFEKTVGPRDYETIYNSYKGTALGLAHTLGQTAIFRPKNKSRKVGNLYFAGASTHPGIGLPVCLISAQLAAARLMKEQA